MELFLEGITLRPWMLSDASELAAIADNKKIADNIRDGFPTPYTTRDAYEWLNMILPDNNPAKLFAILTEGKIVGSIGLITKINIYRKNIEVGFFVAEEWWRKGIATRAIRCVTHYAFSQFDVVRVYAEVFSDNHGSRRALEKAGFSLEATMKNNIVKNEIIKGSCIYSVLKEEYF
jgi:[ribosomal protein S5]-alanine N-acetyltransferase